MCLLHKYSSHLYATKSGFVSIHFGLSFMEDMNKPGKLFLDVV